MILVNMYRMGEIVVKFDSCLIWKYWLNNSFKPSAKNIVIIDCRKIEIS